MMLTLGTHHIVVGVNISVLFLEPLCVSDVTGFEVEVGADGRISRGFDRASEDWNALSRLQSRKGEYEQSNVKKTYNGREIVGVLRVALQSSHHVAVAE